MGSASSTETSVFGISAARRHTTESSSRPVLTSAIVPGIRHRSGTGRTPASMHSALVFGVELTSNQRDERHKVHPNEKGDDGSDGPVHHVVVGDVPGIPGEAGCG